MDEPTASNLAPSPGQPARTFSLQVEVLVLMAADEDRDDSPTLSPDEVFALLGNETRIAILETLWEEYYRYGVDEAIPFSTLYERVDIDDTGNFNYHLGRLGDHLVRQTADGYKLSPSGFRIVNAIIGGAVTEEPILAPTRVEATCPRCSSPIEITTVDESLWLLCTECEGYYDQQERAVGAFQLPPEGVRTRSPDEVLEASIAYTVGRGGIMQDGVCPDCGGATEVILTVCDSHEPADGICATCGRHFLGLFTFACTSCRNAIVAPSWAPVTRHPAVLSLFQEHGLEHRNTTWAVIRHAYGWDEELLSPEPPAVRITVTHEADELTATVDDTGAVVDVEW